MHVVILGGTGLIGRSLSSSLVAGGHRVTVVSRSPQSAQKRPLAGVGWAQWDGRSAAGWGNLVDGAEVVVNLAGENLGGGRWSGARKARILQSRLGAGQAVLEAIRGARTRPKLLVQASAVGIYAHARDAVVTEKSLHGGDFQAQVVAQWEESTAAVTGLGVRRVVARTGIAFSLEGGVFPLYVLPFRTFQIAGGPLGSGEQYVPWIHLDDHIRALRFLMDSEDAEGAFNLSSPNPARQKELAAALGTVLHRPSLMPAPAFALKAVLGEMSTLVLDGWRQVPHRLLERGFAFHWPELLPAIRDLLGR